MSILGRFCALGILLGAGVLGAGAPAAAVPARGDFEVSSPSTQVRVVRVGGSPGPLAIDHRAGRVFVATLAGTAAPRLYVLDAAGGALLRTLALGTSPSALAVDERTGVVLALDAGAVDANGYPAGPGEVLLLDPMNGRVLHRVGVGVGADAIAVDSRAGRAFVVAPSGRFGATPSTLDVLDTGAGTLLRTVPLRDGGAVALDERGGVAYLSGDGIRALDAATGAVRSTIPVASSGPLLFDAGACRVFGIGSADELAQGPFQLQGFDARSGAVTYAFNGEGRPAPLPLATDRRSGHLLVLANAELESGGFGSSPGASYLIDGRTGDLLHTQYLPDALVAAAVDGRRGRAYVLGVDPTTLRARGSVRVTVLDMAGGRPVGTVPIATGVLVPPISPGVAVGAIGLDEQRGRVFVADATSQMISSFATAAFGSGPAGAAAGCGAVEAPTGGAGTSIGSLPNAPAALLSPEHPGRYHGMVLAHGIRLGPNRGRGSPWASAIGSSTARCTAMTAIHQASTATSPSLALAITTRSCASTW